MMAEKGSKKCSGCGGFVTAREMEEGEYRYSRSGKIHCDDCFRAGEDYASTVVLFTADGDRYTTKFDDDFNYWSDADDDIEWSDEYPDPISSQHYVRTDAWRGYCAFVFGDEFTELASGWVTDWPDATTTRKFDVGEFYESLVNGVVAPPADLYWVFAHTSNVFSAACDVVCRSADKELVEGWLVGLYGGVEELQGWLS
jgi:hypothetical protein